jgi:hypothetical protein
MIISVREGLVEEANPATTAWFPRHSFDSEALNGHPCG